MKKRLKAVGAWKLLVLALELSSLHTETAYRDGAAKRATQLAKFAYSGNWEVPRIEPEPENTGEGPELDYSHCAAAADRTVSCCRLVALIFTALLLIRHLFAVLTVGTGGYPFSLLTVSSSSVFYLAHNGAPAPVVLPINKNIGLKVGFLCAFVQVLIVKAGGILVPMYTLIRILAVIHNRIKHQGNQVNYCSTLLNR
ncbi:UNVERIFIED_CONTAM: hypothetical protein Sradi_1304100 [Sesamum radiatum]|uniref:Uncharacterized protein n=1 Tax=Sesamum radiatum TaxID=300843 RepID=A0AAW2USA4_SESRA